MLAELRCAGRAVFNNPRFTLMAVAALALGAGPCASIPSSPRNSNTVSS
jgi:hypothetical protein